MRKLLLPLTMIAMMAACKNNGSGTAGEKKTEDSPSKLKELIVAPMNTPAIKPDFQVLDWAVLSDTLRAVVSYSGGCEQHDFNAYFSGSWLKSLPPQAIIELEHLNPKKDPCRAIVKDTLYFNLLPVRYQGQYVVIVKYRPNTDRTARYSYGK